MNINEIKDIDLGQDLIRINLEQQKQRIHPAIGFIESLCLAYVGVWLSTLVKSKKEGIPEIEKDLLFLLTSNRELILANDETLREKGLALAHKPIRFEDRWKLEDVKRYLAENPTQKIEPTDVLEAVLDAWHVYLELPGEPAYLFQALWDISTMFHKIFNVTPYLYLGGVKRCGKTKALTLHSVLAFNAISSASMSSASLYRLIQNASCTLTIDETEVLRNPERAAEFRTLLLSGYKKACVVYRIEKDAKDKLVPTAFEIYAPKALANIGGLENVLEDRCIVLVLLRSNNRRIKDRDVDTLSPQWPKLRDGLYRLYLDHWQEVREIYNHFNELAEKEELIPCFAQLTNRKSDDFEVLAARQLELWKGIFAVAAFFDNHTQKTTPGYYLSQMIELALDTSNRQQTEDRTETSDMILVETLLRMTKDQGWKDNFIPIRVICERMTQNYDEPQGWINTSWTGRALRRLGFSDKRRTGTQREIRISAKAVADLGQRLGIVLSDASDATDTCDTVQRIGRKSLEAQTLLSPPLPVGSQASEVSQASKTTPVADRLEALRAEIAKKPKSELYPLDELVSQFGKELVDLAIREGIIYAPSTRINAVALAKGGAN